MTISTTDSRISYNGNGVTTAFAFPYRFFENVDLVVELVSAAGAVTTQVLNTDYTVTGADLDAGGTVTMVTPPASGERLVIRRVLDAVQETDYISGDPFPAESHERALDRLTMLVQQNEEALGRTLQLPPTSEADASTIDVEAVETVAAIAADVTNVALIDSDVTTVAGVAANVTTVAGIAANVTTVAGIAADVSAVAAIDTDVSTVAAAVPDIQAAVADLPALAGKANSGAVGSSLLTMSTARMLGRTTAGTGEIEELTAAQVNAFGFGTRADVASASTVDLSGVTVNNINITGTTTITAFTIATGRTVLVRFNASLTLTNNANIVTQSGANIVTAAGDTCILRATAANTVEVLSYVRGIPQALGDGQTWQDVTGSRALSTDYTNTTGRTIFIHVVVTTTGAGGSLTATIGGVTFESTQGYTTSARAHLSLPVPPGVVYRITGNSANLTNWRELR
jgi:hypothetical protein